MSDDPVQGDDFLMTVARQGERTVHAWNRDPLPPTPVKMYQLTVRRPGTGEARATCADKNQLIDFTRQFESIGYEFLRLELME